MEKIKLLSGKEFQITNIQQSGSQTSVTVSGVPDFACFREELTPDALNTIELYSEGGALCTVLEGYTQLTGKFDILEKEDGGMDITVYLTQPDPVMTELAELRAEIAALKKSK